MHTSPKNGSPAAARKGKVWSGKWLLGSLTLAVGLLMGWGIFSFSQPKVAHIQTAKVFAEFQMTKELQTRLENTKQSRQTILENLELRHSTMQARGAATDSLQAIAREYEVRHHQFNLDNENQSQEYTDQIWTQLNQYLQEYCEAEGLTYLFGASGDGNLMGASSEQDLTEDIISFINQQYKNG